MVYHMMEHVQVYHTYLEVGSLLRSLCGVSKEGTCSGFHKKVHVQVYHTYRETDFRFSQEGTCSGCDKPEHVPSCDKPEHVPSCENLNMYLLVKT